MQHLDELNTLIDKAAKAAGSDNKLAISLGVTRQRISNWRHAHQACTPADQALMAHIAGLDPVQVLARATVEAYEGKPKGDALMKALGKALLATGAAIGSAGAAAHQIFSTAQSVPSFATAADWLVGIYTMCIMLNKMSTTSDATFWSRTSRSYSRRSTASMQPCSTSGSTTRSSMGNGFLPAGFTHFQHASSDIALSRATCADLTVTSVRTGHWLPRERKAEHIQAIRTWLQSKKL